MAKTATISARVDQELKGNVERIFGELGISTSQALTLFFKQVEMHKGLPFAVRIFNQETVAALQESENYSILQAYDDVDELFAALDA